MSVATHAQLEKILVATHMHLDFFLLQPICNWKYSSCNPYTTEKILVAIHMQLQNLNDSLCATETQLQHNSNYKS
jgi:hypothetical protein